MVLGVAATLLIALIGANALAQSYPSKPIRLQVPFVSGGTPDIIARAVAGPLALVLGQPVNVEYRPGNGGAVGANDTAKSAPDGYSLGLATVSTTAANPAFNPKVLYDALTDFTAIINIAVVPKVFAVHPSFPAKDHVDFVEALKKSPGKYTFASPGSGSEEHLRMALYQALTGTVINHNAYRGAAPALMEVVSGRAHMVLDSWPSAAEFIEVMRLRPILVAAPRRLPNLPQVPTFQEAGLESLNRLAYYGIYAPQGLPKEIVEKINTAMRKVLQDPVVKKKIEDTGAMIVGNTPQQFADQMKAELQIYKNVVESAKLKLQ